VASRHDTAQTHGLGLNRPLVVDVYSYCDILAMDRSPA